ncbi:hypothetical protein ACIPW5_00520 [Streptomyces sp. NPDC090077]|uniref:hypothetical protein n=1 Tax=Streptomyces sp. NPDC090077 TaxID=3365938 RepID=UPI00382575C7
MSSTISPDHPIIRELVLLGDSAPGRRAGRTVVAQSHCEIDLGSDAALERCVQALRASDERLAELSDGPYDWQRTWVERNGQAGGKVVFDVAWYDEEFFQEKKDTFLAPEHLAMYANIGAEEGAVRVTHWHKVD